MAIIIQYQSNYGINSLPSGGASPVDSWLNTQGASWHLHSVNSQSAAIANEDINGTGNFHPVVQTNDVSLGTQLATNEDFPDLTLSGFTIFLVARQSIGNFNNDQNGLFIQAPGLSIGRSGANNKIAARWGINTPTTIEKVINNDTFYIICFKSDNVSQYLSINNDTPVISSDVSTFYVNGKLTVIANSPACKGIVHIRVFDQCLSDADETTVYNGLVSDYLTTSDTTAVLSFPSIADKTYGDSDFNAGVTSNSPAAITYTSSDESVAIINSSGVIQIIAVGTCNITASQGATTGYTAATDVTRSLTINNATAVITFNSLPTKKVGDADFAPGATSNSPAAITYASSNTSVATIVGGQIHIVAEGTTTITASQGATTNYTAASDVSKTLTVSAAPVTTSNSKLYGLWRIDGIDIWTTYRVALETGSADFLKFPPKKQSIEHDWGDSDGIDVDLSRIYTGKREGVLNFAIFANTNEEYFNKHDAFFALWKQPGTRRLEIAAHNNRSYLIYYQETNNWQQIAALEPVSLDGNSYLIAHKFSIVVVEPEPKLYPGNVYIVTEDGKFLIT